MNKTLKRIELNWNAQYEINLKYKNYNEVIWNSSRRVEVKMLDCVAFFAHLRQFHHRTELPSPSFQGPTRLKNICKIYKYFCII